MKTIKSILAFFTAVVVAYVLSSAAATQFVLADIKSYGLADQGNCRQVIRFFACWFVFQNNESWLTL